ncbi:ATP-grasp domain-containing protein [Daejeonella oryzae]|uniref:hypothetical protein n=1 Tax=Daejeonella oryzae TaxID=1122943 RepID=UPI00040D471B|nr:hypothetical protein [Daejeonella oryzae]
MPVLITAASHAEAYKLERLLNASDVIFADHIDNSHLKYSGRKHIQIPAGNSASYAHELLKACLDLDIEKIYPLYFDEIVALSEAKLLFDEYGIKVIVPGIDFLRNIKAQQIALGADLVIIEDGKLIAGNLPQNLSLSHTLETGIYCFNMDENPQDIKLFFIYHA